MQQLTKITILIFNLLSGYSNAQSENFNYLKNGDIAPNFSTIDYKNDSIELSKLLTKGKVVIVFYRGAWCPYCNKHMSHLEDSLKYISEKNACVIAISPETEEYIDKTISKTNASFSIIHDHNYSIMKSYGVAFEVNESTVAKYKLYGINLEESNGNNDNILPVPATIIINQNGTIDFIHFDEDYKKRLSVSDILMHL